MAFKPITEEESQLRGQIFKKLTEEESQLRSRLSALEDVLDSYEPNPEISPRGVVLMQGQYSAMMDYHRFLESRLHELFGGEYLAYRKERNKEH